MKTLLANLGVTTGKSGGCPPQKHWQIWRMPPFPSLQIWRMVKGSKGSILQSGRQLSAVGRFSRPLDPSFNFACPMYVARDKGYGEGFSEPESLTQNSIKGKGVRFRLKNNHRKSKGSEVRR